MFVLSLCMMALFVQKLSAAPTPPDNNKDENQVGGTNNDQMPPTTPIRTATATNTRRTTDAVDQQDLFRQFTQHHTTLTQQEQQPSPVQQLLAAQRAERVRAHEEELRERVRAHEEELRATERDTTHRDHHQMRDFTNGLQTLNQYTQATHQPDAHQLDQQDLFRQFTQHHTTLTQQPSPVQQLLAAQRAERVRAHEEELRERVRAHEEELRAIERDTTHRDHHQMRDFTNGLQTLNQYTQATHQPDQPPPTNGNEEHQTVAAATNDPTTNTNDATRATVNCPAPVTPALTAAHLRRALDLVDQGQLWHDPCRVGGEGCSHSESARTCSETLEGPSETTSGASTTDDAASEDQDLEVLCYAQGVLYDPNLHTVVVKEKDANGHWQYCCKGHSKCQYAATTVMLTDGLRPERVRMTWGRAHSCNKQPGADIRAFVFLLLLLSDGVFIRDGGPEANKAAAVQLRYRDFYDNQPTDLQKGLLTPSKFNEAFKPIQLRVLKQMNKEKGDEAKEQDQGHGQDVTDYSGDDNDDYEPP